MTRQTTPISRTESLAATLVVLACAASAGIHAGLAPEHLEEVPLLGASFIAATVLLAAIGVAVTLRPRAQGPTIAASLLFGMLILAYTASRTTGLPMLEPDPEAVDPIGLASVVIQLAGLVAALWLVRGAEGNRQTSGHNRPAVGSWPAVRTGSTLVAAAAVVALSVVVALGAAGGHEHGHDKDHHEHGMAAMVHSE